MAYPDNPTIDDSRMKLFVDDDGELKKVKIISVNTDIDDSEIKMVYTSGASRLEFTAKDMGGIKHEWILDEVDHSVSGSEHTWESDQISYKPTPV